MLFSELERKSKKAGLPPGAQLYQGAHPDIVPKINVNIFSPDYFYEKTGRSLKECLPDVIPENTNTWIRIEGLNNLKLIDEVAEQYALHPLTVEDILSVNQRPKVDEFDHYIFVTLKDLLWLEDKEIFQITELALVIGKNFILSFQDYPCKHFDSVHQHLSDSAHQSLRKTGSDYLAYQLIDNVIDQYFLVLEGIGYRIEKIEEMVVFNPTKESARAIYHLKRQMLQLRKAIWPSRDVINHLLRIDGDLISPATHIYFRDVYDHTVQAIDFVETFRDMLSGMLDIYLSSLTNRMNEIMKVLTVIATIFIPITFIASIYGMNFEYIPELKWRWGYPVVLMVMLAVTLWMLIFFKRKKWL